jgi:hypothetical protein
MDHVAYLTSYSYKLPNGETTNDVNIYLAAYDRLAQKALAFFPGYEEVARDPGLVLMKYGVDRFGRRVDVDRLTLSVEAIESLTAPKEMP